MEVTKVTSSNLDSVGYDTATNTLRVIFRSGATYDFAGVPYDVYMNLMSAESIGRAFNTMIRDQYEFERLG